MKRVLKCNPNRRVRAVLSCGDRYILVVKGGKSYISTTPFKALTTISEIRPFDTPQDALAMSKYVE